MTARNRTKIKLCGLSRDCDMEAVNVLKPDYIGFIFAPKSRRYVSPERAAKLKRALDPGIRTVGVFVNEDPDRIAALVESGTIDLVQLHGAEDAKYIRMLRKKVGAVPVIQAFRIDGADDIRRAENSPADLVLLDSGTGGTGTVFDWDLAARLERPCFLAGGLDPENVAAAVARLRPYAVDVSSGIETGGYKDREKMAAFVSAVRAAEQ